jgi:hypothetical protein
MLDLAPFYALFRLLRQQLFHKNAFRRSLVSPEGCIAWRIPAMPHYLHQRSSRASSDIADATCLFS